MQLLWGQTFCCFITLPAALIFDSTNRKTPAKTPAKTPLQTIIDACTKDVVCNVGWRGCSPELSLLVLY